LTAVGLVTSEMNQQAYCGVFYTQVDHEFLELMCMRRELKKEIINRTTKMADF